MNFFLRYKSESKFPLFRNLAVGKKVNIYNLLEGCDLKQGEFKKKIKTTDVSKKSFYMTFCVYFAIKRFLII